jgi:hypothetical protein
MTEHLPIWHNGSVTARCPNCGGAVTRFRPHGQGMEAILQNEQWEEGPVLVQYMFMECLGCGRGGFATFATRYGEEAVLYDFYPSSVQWAIVPTQCPLNSRRS